MCGILGGINLTEKFGKEFTDSALASLAHRGPDDSNCFNFEPNCFIAHARLSIVDLEGSSQPMISPDGRFTLSFNGEIYNYISLRENLKALGHKFITKGDTEVVLKAYIEWGENFVSKLQGMFAFAIWDNLKKEFFLARDPFGIKPLYVYFNQSKVAVFASEIDAFKKLGLPLEINYKKCGFYFRLGYCPPETTLIKQVQELKPGYYAIIRHKDNSVSMTEHLYKSIDLTSSQHLESDEIEYQLKSSVSSHLMSDVPFGAYLSGGLDSTLIVKLMSESLKYSVPTFNIKFQEKGFDESSYARQVSEKYGTVLTSEVTSTKFHELFPRLTERFGQPFGDSSALPTFQVAKETAKHVKMVLSGDGGDELFGGYTRYIKFLQFQNSPLDSIKNFKSHFYGLYHLFNHSHANRHPFKKNTLTSYLSFIERFSNKSISKLLSPELYDLEEMAEWENRLNNKTKDLSPLKKAQWFDYNYYLPGDILKKVDITSMMNSIESRTPLIDIKLFNKVSSLTDNSLIEFNRGIPTGGKKPIKQILSKDFDKEFTHRPKKGFSAPDKVWMKELESIELIRDTLNSVNLKDMFLVDQDQLMSSKNFYTILSFAGWVQWISSGK